MPILSIRHVTRYSFHKPVALGEHRMMLRPRESHDQRLIAFDLSITPGPASLYAVNDVFGNCVSVASFCAPARELVFDSAILLEHTPMPAFADIDGHAEIYAGVLPIAYSDEDLPDLWQSIQRQHKDPEDVIGAWSRRFVRRRGETRLQSLLRDITQAIASEFRYSSRLEIGVQTPLQTLASGSGTCRDFAVLMIDAVRSLGFAARFVSGYIYSPQVPTPELGRVGGGHTHAWVRVYLPACGWVEFDPTNGIVGNADLVRVAIARDPRQAVPLHGTWTGDARDYCGMDVTVDVRLESEI